MTYFNIKERKKYAVTSKISLVGIDPEVKMKPSGTAKLNTYLVLQTNQL
jgi:hypothetical protein